MFELFAVVFAGVVLMGLYYFSWDARALENERSAAAAAHYANWRVSVVRSKKD